MAAFSSLDADRLVELVRRHPAIWNVRADEYRDKQKRAEAWQKIAKALKKPVSECQGRWRSIRDYYLKQKKSGKLASDNPKRISAYWGRLGFLKANEEQDPSCESNACPNEEIIEVTEIVDETEDVNIKDEFAEFLESCGSSELDSCPSEFVKVLVVGSEETSPPKRKRPRAAKAKPLQSRQPEEDGLKCVVSSDSSACNNLEGDDEVDLFFKTMAATVKKFRNDLKRKTKVKVFNIVSEMEALNDT